MKRTLILISAAVLSAALAGAQTKLSKDNIDEVLKAMTLEEKATLCVGGARAAMVEGVTSGLVNEVPGAAGNTRANARLGIPNTILPDGPAGLRINPTREGASQTYYCTGFPVGTLLASSWDTDLVRKVTEAMGSEVREYGCDILLAPGMNIHRNPLCGRNFEYFSEDPVLSGNIAAAYVNGIQSQGVGVSAKHFALNNQETNRNEDDAIVSEKALREIYLKNFEIMVRKSGPWTMMSSYNKLNGEYTQQSHDLLTKILRDDWGYRGIVMTDWGNKAGTVKAVIAGNDLMEPGNQNEIDRIVAAVRDGSLPEADLDRNVRRLLEYIVKTPHFNGYRFTDKPDLKAHAEIARSAAAEAMVLLRNEDGTLPLKGVSKVALYGLGAINFIAGGTGSGNVNKAYVVNMYEAVHNAGMVPDESLEQYYKSFLAYNSATTTMVSGRQQSSMWTSSKQAEIEVPAAAIERQAGVNDAAFIVISRNAGEGGDRKVEGDFELSSIERDLITNVSNAYHKAGRKVVVILNIGGVMETASWKNLADAILLPWSPGQEGANAVMDVLTGKVNPSGKLPMTFPLAYFDIPSSVNFPYYNAPSQQIDRATRQPVSRKDVDYTVYAEDIWVGYRYFNTAHKAVSYPFGYGLSYTSFAYSKPTVKAAVDGFTASVTVTNTGKVSGREVVELYVSAPEGGLVKPERELKGFAKTATLAPGESQTLSFSVSAYELASFNEEVSQWETAEGNYTVEFSSDVQTPLASATYRQKAAKTFSVSAHACAPKQEFERLTVNRQK